MTPNGDRGGGRERFGQALAAGLRARRVTQVDLADRLGGLAQSTVSTWVRGHAEPDHEVVFAIEEVLDLPPGELSRHLGYLPVDGAAPPVENAIAHDPRLTDDQRAELLDTYRRMVERAREQ